MNRKPFRSMLPGLFVLPVVVAAYAGGWAVITIEDLPDSVVARQPISLTFTVRQHGIRPLPGLKPQVEAKAGSLEAKAAANPTVEAGRYTATLALPQPGDWAITIHSGFGNSRVTLLPVRAIAPGTGAVSSLPEAERGRRLFVAKGCITCHVHGELSGANTISVGPELTGRRYPAEYLRQFLANPAIAAAPRRDGPQMPNLNLKQQEIAALVAFINAERQTRAGK